MRLTSEPEQGGDELATRKLVDPDATIGDLVRRLADDSRRLLRNEGRLARMEMRESVHTAARGALYLGIAFGTLVISFVALTVFMATGISRLFVVPIWTGTLITAGVLLLASALIVYGGMRILRRQSYTLEETRAEAKETARWLTSERERTKSFDPLR